MTGPEFLDEGCWESGGLIFSGGCKFYIKNKLKSEIFNDKKVYKQVFSCHNQEIKLANIGEISTKILVTFKS